MAQKKKSTLVYYQDMVGMWVYIKSPQGNMTLLNKVAIIDPGTQKIVQSHCEQGAPIDLELVTR